MVDLEDDLIEMTDNLRPGRGVPLTLIVVTVLYALLLVAIRWAGPA